jgi:hypothetical protein
MTNGPGKSDRPTVPEKSPSNAGRVLSDRMRRLLTRWLPLPSVCHPYPLRRMGVVTSGNEPDAGNPLVRIRGRGLEQS